MTDSFLICFLVSFFFFFLSFRDTCIEGGKYEGMSSGLQFYLKLIEWKKKGERREKDNNNMGEGEG